MAEADPLRPAPETGEASAPAPAPATPAGPPRAAGGGAGR